MNRNRIYAIVEGHGEVMSVGYLINKLQEDLQYWHLLPPTRKQIYRLQSSGDFFKVGILENVIRGYKKYHDCVAVIVLVDMDNNCPKEKAFAIATRIQNMEALPFTIVVVCAKCEYEAWFLASLETIHSDQVYPGDPESIRDAKGWLNKQFGYKPTRHQAEYTQKLDIGLARTRSRSFRRLYHALAEIMAASEKNQTVVTPTDRNN